MTVIVGVIGAAVLFGLFTVLRPSDNGGCAGQCPGCTHDGKCETNGVNR
jgi:attachment p12 family protein